MKWPGMGDPYKRKKTLRFLIITAVIGISVAAGSTVLQHLVDLDNPLKVCINDKNTPYKIKATLELIVDNKKADIPAKIGFNNNDKCQRSLFTLTDDGTIYAQWTEVYPFQIGHFLWVWDFPLRDMDQTKSKMYVNGVESDKFINAPLQEGYYYKAVFTSKAYDSSKDTDFMPPQK